MIRTTQDDARENEQIRLFGLNPYGGRSNKYIPDAWYESEGVRHDIEFKSTVLGRSQVSTCRGFGYNKIEEWKRVSGFIFSQYKQTDAGFMFLRHVFCTPEDLEPWFDEVRRRLWEGQSKGYSGYEIWSKVKQQLEESGTLTEVEMQRFQKSVERGTKLNDPRISWKRLDAMGVEIDTTRPAEHLRELIKNSSVVRGSLLAEE